MNQEQSDPNRRSLSFQESVKFLRDFIAKMLAIDRELRGDEDKAKSEAAKVGDLRSEHISGVAISSYNNAEGLYLIASYLLDILETQALVNQQLIGYINRIATKPIPPATVGEIVRSAFDELARKQDEEARKLHRFLYT